MLNNLSAASVEIGNATSATAPDTNTGGVTLANLSITGSLVGIRAYGDLSSTGPAQSAGTTNNLYGTNANGSAVRNVAIAGSGNPASQRGVWIAGATSAPPADPSGRIEMTDTVIANMTNTGFLVGGISGITPLSGGNADIDFSGSLTSDIRLNGGVPEYLLTIANRTGGTINMAYPGAPAGSTIPNQIRDVGGEGIFVASNAAGTALTETTNNIGNVTLNDSANNAITILNDNSITNILTTPDAVLGFGINKPTPGSAITIQGTDPTAPPSPTVDFFGTINNTGGLGSTPGYLVQINDVEKANIKISGPGTNALVDTGDGVAIESIDIAGGDSDITLANLDLFTTGNAGIDISNIGSATAPADTNILISGAQIGGGVGLASGPSGSGITVTNVFGTAGKTDIELNNVNIDLQGALATGLAIGNITGGSALDPPLVKMTGQSTIKTLSTSAPAISVNNANAISLDLVSVESGNDATKTTPAPSSVVTAINLDNPLTTPSAGTINIRSNFDVGVGTATAAQGTTDNITNNGSVEVFVRGAKISP